MNRQTDVHLAAPLAAFADPDWTARGEPRAKVRLQALRTLWFNTGTLCNIECRNCYILSSPRNDALAYLTLAGAAGEVALNHPHCARFCVLGGASCSG
jgi:hypothetical protein